MSNSAPVDGSRAATSSTTSSPASSRPRERIATAYGISRTDSRRARARVTVAGGHRPARGPLRDPDRAHCGRDSGPGRQQDRRDGGVLPRRGAPQHQPGGSGRAQTGGPGGRDPHCGHIAADCRRRRRGSADVGESGRRAEAQAHGSGGPDRGWWAATRC